MGSLSLLQGIFPTQESNPGLPYYRQILFQLSHKGSPRKLEWVAYPFSSRPSWTQELNQGLLHCRQILYQLGNTKQGPTPEHLSAPPWMPGSVELLYHFSPNGYLYNLMTDPKGNMPSQTLSHKTMSQIKWLF